MINFAEAQRQYDAMTPPEEDPACIACGFEDCECSDPDEGIDSVCYGCGMYATHLDDCPGCPEAALYDAPCIGDSCFCQDEFCRQCQSFLGPEEDQIVCKKCRSKASSATAAI